MIQLKKLIIGLLLLVISLINGQTIEIEKAKVTIEQNEIVFKVKGLVCSFCAQGLQKSLSKLDFIDKKKHKKGVYVDIENQYTLVAIKKNVKVELDQAISAITDAGYEVEDIFHNPNGDKIELFPMPPVDKIKSQQKQNKGDKK